MSAPEPQQALFGEWGGRPQATPPRREVHQPIVAGALGAAGLLTLVSIFPAWVTVEESSASGWVGIHGWALLIGGLAMIGVALGVLFGGPRWLGSVAAAVGGALAWEAVVIADNVRNGDGTHAGSGLTLGLLAALVGLVAAVLLSAGVLERRHG